MRWPSVKRSLLADIKQNVESSWGEQVCPPKLILNRKVVQVGFKTLENKTKRVFADDSRPEVSESFPFTERYFHKAFAEQGLTADGLDLWEIELACMRFWEGERYKGSDSDIYEMYEFDRDFVHDDDLSHDLNRVYDPEFNDGDARWSFSFVKDRK